MQYTALYRKYRPGLFSGVIGQDHIVKTLKNQLLSDRISHAYLFCGTRGTGKTSTAKIFAKVLNCSSPINCEPCGKCRSCREIAEQTNMNVIEIDAASNNGVDNIRDIREEVKYPPVNGKRKVYIIDEVHMLSTGAFNALLKTLEEPPTHIVFILATTDPQKIPATIHSRCQRFDFRRISVNDMAEKLQEYMNDENIEVDENALRYISGISDGALRDAISILDQCISFYYGERITLEKALEITGSVDDSVFFKLTGALSKMNSIECIEIINDVVMLGRDISQFVTEYIVHLRNLLVSAAAPGTENALGYSGENIQSFIKSSDISIDSNKIIEYISAFSQLQGKLRYASNDRILLEVCCIQICNPVISSTAQTISAEKPKETIQQKPAEHEKKKEKAVPDDYKAALTRWSEFTSRFAGMEGGFLKATKAGYLESDYLFVVCDSISAVSILKKKEDIIIKKIEEYFGKKLQLNFVFKDTYAAMHKKQFGAPDDFDYSDKQEIEKIKNLIDMDIKVE